MQRCDESYCPSPPTHARAQVELGSGASGKVYQAKYRGMAVAVKTISFAQSKDKDTFLKEVGRMCTAAPVILLRLYVTPLAPLRSPS